MLKLFPNNSDELLDVDSLPPTQNTELNYRTRPLSGEQEIRLTVLLLFATLPTITILGVSLHFVCTIIPGFRHIVTSASIILFGWIGWRRLTGALQRWDLYAGIAILAAAVTSLAWHWSLHADLDSMRFGVFVAWVAGALIARQAAAWIHAAPTVDHERMKRW